MQCIGYDQFAKTLMLLNFDQIIIIELWILLCSTESKSLQIVATGMATCSKDDAYRYLEATFVVLVYVVRDPLQLIKCY